MIKTAKSEEFKHFNKLSSEWWSEKGKYQILHEITPLRMEYILKNIGKKNIKKLNVLDLGCGGGLICEPIKKLGAKVTGVDFVEDNIKVAKMHAVKNKLNINYLTQDLENLKINEKFDLIIMFEVLEHLDNWKNILKEIKKILKINGYIILSTINRNIISNIFAIKIAENFLQWVPKNTHQYNKLIKPKELKDELLKENFSIKDFSGLLFNPFSREWILKENKTIINYFCSAQLIN